QSDLLVEDVAREDCFDRTTVAVLLHDLHHVKRDRAAYAGIVILNEGDVPGEIRVGARFEECGTGNERQTGAKRHSRPGSIGNGKRKAIGIQLVATILLLDIQLEPYIIGCWGRVRGLAD